MHALEHFLLPTQPPKLTPPPIHVTIFTPDTLETHPCQLYLHGQHIVLRLPQLPGVFKLKEGSKMTPKYSTSENSVLQKLSLHLGQEEIVLDCGKRQELSLVYQRLKWVLSHKGFNEYFKPIKRLGKGAFATVYLIEHRATKKRWAAKVFSREGQKLQFKGQQALDNEIKTLRYLSHPNVIQYEGVYETENLIYLVTEYLSGGTLDEYMRDKSKLSAGMVLTILTEVLTALQYLQQKQVMHRDLKPENILLRESDGKWVLADFGLSAFLNEDHIYDKCGTMGYMAPEILCQNKEERLSQPFSSSCDLYSLGVIAYELICGTLPFKVQGEGLLERKVVWDGWTKPECAQLHPQAIVFLRGVLEVEPRKRWGAGEALSSAFVEDKQVRRWWEEASQKRQEERFQKILRMANIN